MLDCDPSTRPYSIVSPRRDLSALGEGVSCGGEERSVGSRCVGAESEASEWSAASACVDDSCICAYVCTCVCACVLVLVCVCSCSCVYERASVHATGYPTAETLNPDN